MSAFFGTYSVSISSRNLICIPAAFRKVLERGGQKHAFVYPSLWRRCLEGCRIERIESLARQAATGSKRNRDENALLEIALNTGRLLKFDNRGRMSLPDEFLAIAGLSSDALFSGRGKTFEIWQPTAFRRGAKSIKDQCG